MAGALAALRPRLSRLDPNRKRVYVQASPNNLTRPNLIRRILAYEQARYLCLVHDLIPLEFPEYGRADGVRKHQARVETLTSFTDGIITNSHATMASLKPWIEASGRRPACAVAHLGTHIPPLTEHPESISERPYFVCIGTIEPRKNHLLLLHIWRRLSEQMGPDAVPKLFVIGRRGWENEQVVDMLERCAALRDCVEERNLMSDTQVATLLSGARALLLPSFAEGYGMPVTEALSLNVPVICSDLPALREAGGSVPEFLDPLDGLAWAIAIRDYASASSTRRARQLQQLKAWSAPSWDDHMETVLSVSDRIAQ
jgi:glycosyltransferase involved in cell wall biosynthesis